MGFNSRSQKRAVPLSKGRELIANVNVTIDGFENQLDSFAGRVIDSGIACFGIFSFVTCWIYIGILTFLVGCVVTGSSVEEWN